MEAGFSKAEAFCSKKSLELIGMYNLINLIYKIKDVISQYRDLNVVSLKRTLFLILIIFVMIFDA